MQKLALALALSGCCIASAPASATTINILATNGVTTVASGSFSYATGTTGVLGYSNLTSFSLTISGVTYSLANVLPLTDYSQFQYDTSTNQLLTNSNACGFAGCGFVEILGAIKSDGSYGFFFNPPPGFYQQYNSPFAAGTYTNLTLSPAGGVPEPASWAMMLMGFGLVGFGLRNRRKQAARVTYA